MTAPSTPTSTAPDTSEPWYRSKSFLVIAAVVVILAITVITDLPAPATHASNVAAATTVITTINTDLAPCSFAVTEALEYQRIVAQGEATSTQRAQAPQLLNDDVIACSLVNSSVFDLSDSDVPGSATAKQLGSMLDVSTNWAVRDAHDTIAAIQALQMHPDSAANRAALRAGLALMTSDRTAAIDWHQQAAAILGSPLLPLKLPTTPPAASLLGPG